MAHQQPSAFQQALQQQSEKVLANMRQKQQDAEPKPQAKDMQRDYDVLIIMRHSKRIDQHPKLAPHLKWDEKDQYLRPYDPPLCDFDLPISKIKEVYSFIPTLHITKIVISPFLRCIQTAAVIGKHLNCKRYEIDARLGENSLAINRCILHAKKKQEANPNAAKYKIPTDYHGVSYLSMQQIENILKDGYQAASNVNATTDEEKTATDVEEKQKKEKDEIVIEWSHQEAAGNHLHVECAKEYMALLKEKQQLKKNEKGTRDVLMITHGQVVSDINEEVAGKILTVDECGWICLTHTGSPNIYSPTAVQILYDKNAQD